MRLPRDEDDPARDPRLPRRRSRSLSMAHAVNTAKGTVVMSDCCLATRTSSNLPTGLAESLESRLNAYARIRAEGDVVVPLYDPALLERFQMAGSAETRQLRQYQRATTNRHCAGRHVDPLMEVSRGWRRSHIVRSSAPARVRYRVVALATWLAMIIT
jgi:hypothetical protein